MPLTSINLVIDSFFQAMESFFPFENQPTIAVATSGGPDSLALCLLLKLWITKKQGKLISLTVDHRLRPDSAAEAQQVNQWLTAHGVEHHTLTWFEEKPTTDIQNKARQARYHLLEKWCETHQILHLFLGHHGGDQEETVLQRLLHASGPVGLQGMRACTYRPFGRLLRPLLKLSKQQLIHFLDAHHQPYFNDPSNLNLSFERIKMRALLPQLEGLTNTPYPLSQLALKCHDFSEIAQDAVAKFMLEAVSLHVFGFLQLNKDAFLALSQPLQTLVLSHCLQTIGASPYPFSGTQLSGILKKIIQHQNTTIGGCFIVHKSLEIWIVREARAVPPSTPIHQPHNHWDNRFIIEVPQFMVGSIIIPQAAVSASVPPPPLFSNFPNYVIKTLPHIQHPNGGITSVLTSDQGIFWRLKLNHPLTSPF